MVTSRGSTKWHCLISLPVQWALSTLHMNQYLAYLTYCIDQILHHLQIFIKLIIDKDIFFFRRKHYLCISAPAMPLPPSPPPPGPGHYNLVDYQGPPHKFVSSSMFVSSTGRIPDKQVVESILKPGPGRTSSPFYFDNG